MRAIYHEIGKTFKLKKKYYYFEENIQGDGILTCHDCAFEENLKLCSMICCGVSDRLDGKNTIVKEIENNEKY